VQTPQARGRLVDLLCTAQPWRARPARRIYIPKADGRLRPLGIPTVLDRCLQARVKNALEPVWEARFEGTSYGFRPGRGCHDAIAKVFLLANSKGRKPWVVDADIKGAFDHIRHSYLLAALGPFPGRALIKQWLEAGYLDEGAFHPTDAGTGQGAVISPLLANIALHGMEAALGVQRTRAGGIKGHRAVVRYADDVRHITVSEIPVTDGRGPEEMTSGSPAYLAAKAQGDRSMPRTRVRPAGAYGRDPQDPRDRVKAVLPEPEFPAMQAYIPRSRRLSRGRRDRAMKSSSPEPSARRAVANEATQGDPPGTYVALYVSPTGNVGSPTGREPYGDGASVVVRGRESRPHGEGRQVASTPQAVRYS
jgi:hypothetical protein